MPYRIDLSNPPARAFDALVELGALDIEVVEGALAALIPDRVPVSALKTALGVQGLRVSKAIGRDDDSVWTLGQRPVRVGSLMVVPVGSPASPDAIVLADRPAFGTGMHPTTALCVERIEQVCQLSRPARMLDVGTGSGILALAALRHGVEQSAAIDVDRGALRAAQENAHLNGLADRCHFVCGAVESVRGSWPLVVANIRAAELMEIAPALVPRLASKGHIILSGIAHALGDEVQRIYRRLGVTTIAVAEREGWTAMLLRPSW